MSVLVHFSIFPIDKGEQLSGYVARAIQVIEESGLPYQLEAMGTTMEGEWDEVMQVVKKCYEALSTDCGRILIHMKMDCKKVMGGRMTQKVQSVTSKLKRKSDEKSLR